MQILFLEENSCVVMYTQTNLGSLGICENMKNIIDLKSDMLIYRQSVIGGCYRYIKNVFS